MPATQILKDRFLNTMRGTAMPAYTPHLSFATDVPTWMGTPAATELTYDVFARQPATMAAPSTVNITTRRSALQTALTFPTMTTGAGGHVGYGLEYDALTGGALLRANPLPNVGSALTITGAVTASGLIELTFSAPHLLATGMFLRVASVGGVPNATGEWKVTVTAANKVTLNGSTFAGTYTSGGTAQRFGFEVITGVAPQLAIAQFYADMAD